MLLERVDIDSAIAKGVPAKAKDVPAKVKGVFEFAALKPGVESLILKISEELALELFSDEVVVGAVDGDTQIGGEVEEVFEL